MAVSLPTRQKPINLRVIEAHRVTAGNPPKPAMSPHQTTIDAIPPEMLAAHGLTRNGAVASSFKCTDPGALRIPTASIEHPANYQVKWDTAGHLLRRIHDQVALDPIVVTRRPGNCQFVLVDGLHRRLVSMAVGFPSMPARLLSYDTAQHHGFR